MRNETMTKLGVASAIAIGIGAAVLSGSGSAETVFKIPPPKSDQYPENRTDVAVLAGGCFWGMEGLFEHVKGVESVTSGYAGGTAQSANYSDVSSESTHHAEAIRITYNPAKITYGTLLRIYFSVAHDPTQLNRQGPDSGTSYRSAIFPQDATQTNIAKGYIALLGASKAYPRPIVTRIEQGKFFAAEAYHQHFMQANPNHPYIRQWDAPKLAAFKATYSALWK
jgi:peptide-methionine (S)-S-oxide reductase